MHRRRIAAVAITIGIVGVLLFVGRSAPLNVVVSYQTIVVDGNERSFRVVSGHQRTKPMAVVFAFHGIGDSADSMANYTQLDKLADSESVLLIYPTGRGAMWATINVQPESLDANPDVRFFDAMLKQIESQYEIDLDRVYLLGMSNGASFAQLLANARPRAVAAVVAHSGSRPRILGPSTRAFPILLIVGSDDRAVDLMQADLRYYRDQHHDVQLHVVNGLGHEWSTAQNQTAWKFLAKHTLADETN